MKNRLSDKTKTKLSIEINVSKKKEVPLPKTFSKEMKNCLSDKTIKN